MAEHVLKTWPGAFDAVRDGRKRFEWRKDDRGFEVGDTLILEMWDPTPTHYGPTGYGSKVKSVTCRVTYILRGLFDVPAGYCVMSIEALP